MEPRRKTVHRAKLVNDDGKVSPLCAPAPRPINLKLATWTLVDALVTCSRCRRKIAAQARTARAQAILDAGPLG